MNTAWCEYEDFEHDILCCSHRVSLRINLIKVDLFPLNMIPYSTLVAMAAVGTSPMPVFFALIIFNQPEVVVHVVLV